LANEIQGTSFSGVTSRLGVNPPILPFRLSDIVIPVSIVDQDVDLNQVQIPILSGAPATEGELVAPAATTLLADTGQLVAGTWALIVWIGAQDTLFVDVQHRNAANGANIWSIPFFHRRDTSLNQIFSIRLTFLTDERFRVLVRTNVAAGNTVQCNIFTTQIST